MKTLYEDLLDRNAVAEVSAGKVLLSVRHLLHEVTSPVAFAAIRKKGGTIPYPELCLAVPDHNIPTSGVTDVAKIVDPDSRAQVQALYKNCADFGIEIYPMGHKHQGIVHMVGPETGFTRPGTVIVCGDSHTATHGAFGALAMGIGTSEVQHALETGTNQHGVLKTRLILVEGVLAEGAQAKDVILHIIAKLGADGGSGYAYEFGGSVIRSMSMEERMTVCNMAIEGGARVGLVGVDTKTLAWIERTPKFLNMPSTMQEAALKDFATFVSSEDATFDDVVTFHAEDIVPMVTWGTSPEQASPVSGSIPALSELSADKRQFAKEALEYMELQPGQPIADIPLQHVFIGSCTNGRLSDLQAAAEVLKGKKVAEHISAVLVPGSAIVIAQAEADGTLEIFREAGFDVRTAGCSSCLAMNEDKIPANEHCGSTSNRNFKGRQGPGARTHLISPVVAAASAVAGYITAP